MYNIASSRVETFEVYYFLLKFYLTISFKFFSRIFRFLKFRAREKYQILPVNHISSIPSYHIPFNIHHSSQSYDQSFLKNRSTPKTHHLLSTLSNFARFPCGSPSPPNKRITKRSPLASPQISFQFFQPV